MPAATDTPVRAADRSDRERRLSLVLAALALLPFTVAFIALFATRQGDVPTYGDTALIELTVREVGHHVVLLGPYSRYHWHHPGPMLFDWLAIPYRLFGSDARALYAASVLTTAIATAVVAFVAHRRGGTRLLAWSMIVFGTLAWALGPDVVRAPWNPWITVVPLFAVLTLAWNTTADELWSYPFAVAGGSFLVQSHIGYAAVTIAILSGAAVIVIGQAARHRVPWRRVAIVGIVTLGTFAVLWAPSAYQQIRDEPGNLSELQQFFSDAKTDHTLGDGVSVTVRELGTVPAQLVHLDAGRAVESRAPVWAGILTLAALGGAVAVALTRRAWHALSLAGLVGLSIVAAAWSVARVIGPIEDYLVLWIAVAGAGAWVALGAALLTPGVRPPAKLPLRLLGGAVLALALLNSWNAWRAAPPQPIGAQAVPPLTRSVRSAIGPSSERPILVRSRGTSAWAMAAAVMVDLERRGYDTVVDPKEAWLLGEHRVRAPGQKVAATLTFADPAAAAALDASPDQRLLGRERAIDDVSVFVRT